MTSSLRRTAIHAVVAALLGAFLSFIVCVSVGPLSDWTQHTAACPGADRVERIERRGPDVPAAVNGREVGVTGTTNATLVCAYGSEQRLVGNDEAVLKGFALALLIGALGGVALLLGRRVLVWSRQPASGVAG